jgi:predicted Zn-dependent peptidase
MEFHTHTLPNGLEIVAECNGAAYSTALGFFVCTGSRDETDAVAGVSHFLEHMVFKGTPRRSADDVNREFDEMGAHYNAFTNEENTVFYAAVLPEQQDRAVDLLADILRPSLREDDFQTEKKVILEEIQMYEDQPPFGADDKCRALYYGPHPLGRSVLGTAESIGALTAEAMLDYFHRQYSPSNIVLAGAGRIDFDALVATVDRCCDGWESKSTHRRLTPVVGQDGFHVLHRESANQQYAMQLTAGPAAEDGDRYAAKLLAMVLGDDSGSRLYWELVDPGLAEHVSLSHCEHEAAGMMMTYLCCEPEQTADNLRRILALYRQVEASGVAPAELEQAKNKVRSRVVLSAERPRGRLFAVGNDWIYRREYRPTDAELRMIAEITVDDLGAVLQKYPLSRSTTVTIGPLAELPPPR